MTHIVHKDESFKVMGACFEVYKLKGCGFTEPVYQECLALEFTLQQIPFVAQPILELEYKGARLNQTLRPDFICYDKIVVELKALPFLIDLNKAQVINYLNATKYLLAL